MTLRRLLTSPPSCSRHHDLPPTIKLGTVAIMDRARTPSTTSPLRNLRQANSGPRHRLRFASAPKPVKATWALTLPPGSAFRPSIVPPTASIGASVLALCHPWSNYCSSQSRHRSAAAAENRGTTADYGFPPQYMWLKFQDNRLPIAARLLRDRSFVTSRTSRPELHFHLELHRGLPQPLPSMF